MNTIGQLQKNHLDIKVPMELYHLQKVYPQKCHSTLINIIDLFVQNRENILFLYSEGMSNDILGIRLS